MKKIRVAILGCGNCASALVQGVAAIRGGKFEDALMFKDIGGYSGSDIEFVAAFDVDARKVGKPLHHAIYALPNCCYEIMPRNSVWATEKSPCMVQSAPLFDGIADHMYSNDIDDAERFYVKNSCVPTGECYNDPDDALEAYEFLVDDYADRLRQTNVDVLLNYLPVGSQAATEFWMNVCLKAGVHVVNCIPVFIASNKVWAKKFVDAGVTIIGDDMRSMIGASIISAQLQELFLKRGATVEVHMQDNIGGNTDFLNMQDQKRLASKKISKENVVRAQNALAGVETKENTIAAGPAKYFPALGDNKRAHWLIKGTIFGGAPFEFTADLSCQDSPNSAGVVIDAIRLLKVATELGIVGPLVGPSSFTQKSPSVDMFVNDAHHECEQLAKRIMPKGYAPTHPDMRENPIYAHTWVYE